MFLKWTFHSKCYWPVVDDFEDALTGLNVDCGGGRAFASVVLEGDGCTHAATADSAMVTVILAPPGFLGSPGTELGLEEGSLGLEDFKVVGCWRELKLSRPWGKWPEKQNEIRVSILLGL